MTQGQETAMGYAPPLAIAGIYEVCIGVPDPIFAIQYWEQFGYRIGQVGELPQAFGLSIVWGKLWFAIDSPVSPKCRSWFDSVDGLAKPHKSRFGFIFHEN